MRRPRHTVGPEQRRRILDRDDWVCQYCGAFGEFVDHIIPASHRWISRDDNLCAVCAKCNGRAGSRIFRSFEEKKRTILIERFNPDGNCAPVSDDEGATTN